MPGVLCGEPDEARPMAQEVMMFPYHRATKAGASKITIWTAAFCALWSDLGFAQQKPAKILPIPVPSCCLPATTTQYESSRVIYQQFPATGPGETAWVIAWSEHGNKGLWIEGAWFLRKHPFTLANSIQVLGRAGLSDIFVPYHTGTARYYDLHFGGLLGAIPQDAGACGAITDPLITPPGGGPPRKVLIKEIRDRGVAWTSDRQTRRGEEVLLWATYDAGNYEYVIQYGFRDDGTVTFRLGSTGYNSPVSPFAAHMHNALWYVDVNLAGAAHNSVVLMKHVEPTGSLSAADSMAPFNGGVEGWADWNDKEFTHLNISSTVTKNAQGRFISYDMMPMTSGIARHIEDTFRHDFWVTLQKPNELEYGYGFEGWAGVPYITPPEPIVDQDVALWHMSSNHHLPRDEDHEYGQPIRLPGVALLMWSGFDLHPRNLFDDTPLHDPPCAMVPPGLVGWWPLDDASGQSNVVAINAIGAQVNSNFGVSKPSAVGAGGPASVTGVVGNALSFDGSNDHVEIPNNATLNFGTGDLSIDAWVKTSQSSGVAVLLDKRRGTPLQGYHLFTSNGNLFIQLAVGGIPNNYPSNAFIADGNWHHIAVSVNRTSGPFTITWYLDGINLSPNPAAPPAGPLTSNVPLRLGVRSTSLSGYWNGTLDELELFNRALTDGEVFAIYAAGRNGKCGHP